MSAAKSARRGAVENLPLYTDDFSPFARMREEGTPTFLGNYEDAIARIFVY